MISLKPEIISTVSGLSLTDSLMATLVNDAVIILIIVLLNRALSLRPGTLQNIIESIYDYFYDLTRQIAGVRTDMIFPWFAAFFMVILVDNFMGLLPGVGTIVVAGGEHGHIPLFRGTTSDLNTTVAMAAVSVVVTHILSVRQLGLKHYLMHFFSLNPIFLFVGILELVSEATKLVSLSFRLFGNMFAGEVVLSTVNTFGLGAFVQPIPFLMLECIVAFIQALVFAMLTMVFMSVMTTPHSQEE